MKKMFSIIILAMCTIPAFGIKNFVLISAPGSGKGTFSQYITQKYGHIQICPGDIFRNEISNQTELGKKIQPIVEKNEYVDEKIVCQLIADKLESCLQQNKPFIIDGFPRSEISFQFLYTFLQDHNLIKDVCFLQFITNDETCIKRIESRQFCTECAKVYNISSAPSRTPNKCDDCETMLTTRKADTKNIAKDRLDYFHKNVEGLIQRALKLYETKIINTECPLQELPAKYDQIIEVNK